MGGKEIPHPAGELRRDLAARQPGEVHGLEFVGHACVGTVRVVDGHGKDEHRTVRHVARPVDGVAPLAAEEALEPVVAETMGMKNAQRLMLRWILRS